MSMTRGGRGPAPCISSLAIERHRILRPMSSAHRPRDARDRQAVPGRARQRRRQLRPRARRGARAPRRERRREVDADEHPLRALQAGRGRDPRLGEVGQLQLRQGRDRLGPRHGAPALHAHPGHDGRREHRARDRADEDRRDPRLRHSTRAGPRARASVRLRDRSRREDRGHLGRPAAARRDPQGALPQGRHPHPRRADRGAHAAGGDGALRDPQGPPARGHVDHLHQPQAERGARDRRPDHRSPARAEDRHRAAGGGDRGRARPHDGRARSASPRRQAACDAGRGRARARRRPRSRRPRDREGSRRLAPGAHRRDRRDRGSRRKRPDRARRGDHRPATARERPHRRRRTRDVVAREPAGDARGGRRPHSGGPPSLRAHPRLHARGERRPARLPLPAGLAVRLASTQGARREDAAPDRGVRRARRQPADEGAEPLGREPAEARRRARGRSRPPRAHRGAADAWPRRRRDRVPPPPARRGARRGARGPPRLARARGGARRSPTGSSSCTRARSSPSTRRA